MCSSLESLYSDHLPEFSLVTFCYCSCWLSLFFGYLHILDIILSYKYMTVFPIIQVVSLHI